MAFADIFYPGNPGRRQQITRLSQRLYDLMAENFRATNDLIDCIHEYVPGRHFMKIYLDGGRSIRDNCRKIIACMNGIQDYVEEINEKLRAVLEPEIYEKIMDIKTGYSEKFRLTNSISAVTIGAIATVAGVVVISCIKAGAMLATISGNIGVFATCACAGLAIAVLAMGADMIISAIVGSIERDRLNDTIDELVAALKTFQPASVNYSKNIYKVIACIEFEMDDS